MYWRSKCVYVCVGVRACVRAYVGVWVSVEVCVCVCEFELIYPKLSHLVVDVR